MGVRFYGVSRTYLPACADGRWLEVSRQCHPRDDETLLLRYGSPVSPWSGPLLAAAGLLVAAGAPKVLRPDSAVRALRSVQLRVPASAVRLGGAVEAAVGAAAVMTGARWAAALVAASYLAFAGFVALALRTGGVIASCGCFGRADTPPTRVHIAVNLLLAAGAAAATVVPPGALPMLLSGSPWGGVPLLGYAAGCAVLAYYAMAVLPTLGGVSSAPSRSQRSA